MKWSSADESVCRVDDDGKASVIGPGRRGRRRLVRQPASRSPGSRSLTTEQAGRAEDDVVDQPQAAELHRRADRQATGPAQPARLAGLRPTPSSSAAPTSTRSAGCPTVDEVRAFLADPSPAKRDALIESLLARPEFADYWTYKWSDVLMLSGTRLAPEALKTYYHWIHKQVAADTPWDQFVRAIVTATGESVENGATNFYALSQSPEDMTENACQAFLGLSIGCAKCHNHPLEKWTNDQYYAMANLFARVQGQGLGRRGRGRATAGGRSTSPSRAS